MGKAATFTPDQIVSFNLTRARKKRGWTQARAAAEISRRLGRQWSVPVYAAAERSHRTARVKEFSASEIMAFCRAFRLPLAWFFLPPDPRRVPRIVPRGGTRQATITADEFVSLLFPRLGDPGLAELEEAAQALFSAFAAQGPPQADTGTYVDWLHRQNAALRTMLRSEFEAHDLDGLPAQLEDAAKRMRQALGLVANDLLHDGMPAPADPDRQTGQAESATSNTREITDD